MVAMMKKILTMNSSPGDGGAHQIAASLSSVVVLIPSTANPQIYVTYVFRRFRAVLSSADLLRWNVVVFNTRR